MTDPAETSNSSFDDTQRDSESSLMSDNELIDHQLEEAWIEQLKRSFEDLEAGRTIPADEVLRMLRTGLGKNEESLR